MSRVNRAAIVACLLILGACSDSERAEPEKPADSAAGAEPNSDAAAREVGLHVVNPGAEPRVQLGILASETASLKVSALSTLEGAVGDERFDDSLSADFVLDIELVMPESGTASARFSASAIETMPTLEFNNPGFWEWQLERDGTLVSTAAPELPAGSRMMELMSTPALFLMVPSEPVGEGASWTYLHAASGTPVMIEISRITDDEIEATLSTRHERAEGTLTVAAAGHWSRTTLGATRATSEIDFESRTTTTINGVEVPVTLTRSTTISYGGVQ